MWPVMEAGKPTPPLDMIDACKNMTLPQTSFTGCNNRLATPFLGLAPHLEILDPPLSLTLSFAMWSEDFSDLHIFKKIIYLWKIGPIFEFKLSKCFLQLLGLILQNKKCLVHWMIGTHAVLSFSKTFESIFRSDRWRHYDDRTQACVRRLRTQNVTARVLQGQTRVRRLQVRYIHTERKRTWKWTFCLIFLVFEMNSTLNFLLIHLKATCEPVVIPCFYCYMSLMTFLTLFLWLHVSDGVCDSVSMVTCLWWRLWLCFFGYRSLMTFVNSWLLNNPQFQVIRCETVERSCQKSGEFDPDKTSYHTPSGGAANFVIILRYEQNETLSFLYRPQTKFVKGNVFTDVRLSRYSPGGRAEIQRG